LHTCKSHIRKKNGKKEDRKKRVPRRGGKRRGCPGSGSQGKGKRTIECKKKKGPDVWDKKSLLCVPQGERKVVDSIEKGRGRGSKGGVWIGALLAKKKDGPRAQAERKRRRQKKKDLTVFKGGQALRGPCRERRGN